ncbi:MAG: NTP transferase domain-containing protein [Anaerolineae bacterium]
MTQTDLAVVILAAGMGTRMNSKVQKILHEVGGRPMVMHVVEASRKVANHPVTLVVGEMGGHNVERLVGANANYVVQAEQLGTGHAALVAADVMRGISRQVAVTYGDMPLLRPETLQKLATMQAESGAAVVITTVMGEATSSYGRIARDTNGNLIEIVEVAEAKQRPNSAELLDIRELNVGVYCFDADFLWSNLSDLPLRQARNGVEYYLTDMIGLAVEQGKLVESVKIEDVEECLGAGTRAELISVDRAFRRREINKWLAAGVTIIDPNTTYIDPEVTIGKDTIIWPNTYLRGNTTIGEDCVIGPNAIITDSKIADGSRIEMQNIHNS